MKSDILSFLYLYGVGGLLFAGSLILLLKRGALDVQTKQGKQILFILFAGYAVYIAYHAATQFVLPEMGGTP